MEHMSKQEFINFIISQQEKRKENINEPNLGTKKSKPTKKSISNTSTSKTNSKSTDRNKDTKDSKVSKKQPMVI